MEYGEASKLLCEEVSLARSLPSFLWKNSMVYLKHEKRKLLSSGKTSPSSLQGQPHVATLTFS